VVLIADPAHHPPFSGISASLGHALTPCLDLLVSPDRDVFVCGAFGCHNVIHERNGTLPPNFRRTPTSGGNDRSGNNNNNARLNVNARVTEWPA